MIGHCDKKTEKEEQEIVGKTAFHHKTTSMHASSQKAVQFSRAAESSKRIDLP